MGHGDPVINAAWSPCSRFIAVGLSKTIEILDGVTLERLHTFPHSWIQEIGWLSFSPDSRLLTLFSDSDYRLITWDLQTGGRIRSIPSASNMSSSFYLSSAYSMDGKIVAVAYIDFDAAVVGISTYNLLSGTHIYSHRDSERPIVAPIWTHGEYLRFATVKPGFITVWEVGFTSKHTLTEIESLPAPDGIGSGQCLFLPTRSRLAFILEQAVMVWDTRDSKTLLNFVGGTPPVGLSFSSDGRFFACGTAGQEIHLWRESPTGYVLHRKLVYSMLDLSWLTAEEDTAVLLLSPNGESIIASKRPETQLWRTTDPVIPLSSVPTRPVTQTRFILVFSQDELLAAVARLEDNMVTIIDLRSGDTRLIIDVGTSIWGLRVTGDTVVVGGDGGIITWNLPAEERVLDSRVNINDRVRTIMFNHPTSPPGSVHSASISPDLYYIAIGRAEVDSLGIHNRLELYNMSTGNYLAGTPMGGKQEDLLCFTPDEQEVWSVDNIFGPQGWKIVKDRKFDVVGLEPLEKAESISDRFPSRGHEVTDDGWILNSRKTRLIWLPHSWRKEYSWGERFLGCSVDGLPEPVILELGE